MAVTDPCSIARFERLYALARDPLARYLARRAAPEAVEDLFAEVMTTAWRRLDDIPGDVELPWLYGTARRVLANHRRATGRFGRLLERVALATPGVDPGLPPASPDSEDLEAAMALIPDADREVLRLWAWEELEAREIGQVLGISANAASIRLHRAKARLRSRMEQLEREEVAVDASLATVATGSRKTFELAGHQPGVERKEAR